MYDYHITGKKNLQTVYFAILFSSGRYNTKQSKSWMDNRRKNGKYENLRSECVHNHTTGIAASN